VNSSDSTPEKPIAQNGPTDNPDLITEGMKVKHQRFGVGLVLQIDGQGQNKKATVKFADGEKQLILKFARLQIIS
jgi:DNA helicase-2/ATP-dependent DNA helicase PcrA